MQVNEGGQRHTGKADVHPRADDWVQHPCLYGRHHSRRRLDMDQFTGVLSDLKAACQSATSG